MIKRFCDNCGAEFDEFDGYGFKIIKSYDVCFLKRNIITYEKQIYDNKEYCSQCYFAFLKTYDDFTKKNKK